MAAAAPELPALGELLAAALTALAWVTCLGVLWLYRRSLKAVILGFAHLIDVGIPTGVHTIHPLRGVANWVRAQAENIDHYISEGAVKSEWASRKLLHAFAQIQIWLAHEIAGVARDAYNAVVALGSRINDLEHAAAAKVSSGVVGLIHKIVNTSVGFVRKEFNRSFHSHSQRLGRLEHQVGARTRPGFESGAIAVPRPATNVAGRLGRIEHDVHAQAKTLGRLKWLIALGGMTAFGRVFFKHFKLGWLRCNNVGRVGRSICLLPTALVTSLFADALEAMVILDLCRFAVAAQALARKVVPVLGVFLLVEDAVCLGGGATLPSAHDSPAITTKIALPSAHD